MPTSAEDVCAQWTAHFFAACDAAVQSYVCQSLVTAIGEGLRVSDLADSFQDFLPTGHCSEALWDGLLQLEAALQQQQLQEGQGGLNAYTVSWLHRAAATAAWPKQAVGTKGVAAAAPQQPVLKQQPAAGSSRGSLKLSASAAEFRPAPAAPAHAAIADDFASLALTGAGKDGEDYSSWQYNEGNCAYDAAWQSYDAAASSVGGGGVAQEAAGDLGGELVVGGPAAHAAFLAVLGDQFPLFSEQALRQLFEEQGGCLAATIHTLCSLEAELQGQQQAASNAAWLAADDTPEGPVAASFTDDDFPSLGATPSGSSGTSSSRTAVSEAAGYARKAKAAAHLPSPTARRRGPPVSTASQSRPAAAAPIWQADGVQQFSTGAALAAEYAAQRAEARDHARLRNACFQQATQAYLAGDRRLAKELGAKGRYHGDQMHSAHQAAAQEMFARRNPGAAGGGPAGGSAPLDLHGLHVSEALDQLEQQLYSMQQRGERRLRVVVGQGTHGKVPARLPAAVRRWLQSEGLQFTEPYAGLLEIRL